MISYLWQKYFLCILTLSVVLVSILLFPVYKIKVLDISSIAEVHNCPLCYGKTMCSCLSKENFILDGNYFWRNLLSVCMGITNIVIFGRCGKDWVVAKKRPIKLDRNVVNLFNIVNFTEILNSLDEEYSKQPIDTLQIFKFCPSHKKLVNYLEDVVGNANNSTEFYLNILFMVRTNMEPIIQQMTKDWAVAEYLGSCGDITVSRYSGDTLTWVVPELDWAARSSIAKQLLQFAYNATFKHPHFAFYFTDMSPDNFAVTSDGTVRLVDLEHVIVVNKYPDDPPENWYIQHESFHDESVNGFTFSTDKVCSHQTSDLNVYSICQGILSEKSDLIDGGLLHSPPRLAVDLRRLVEECVKPPTGTSRFDIAQLIMNALDVR